MRHEVERRLRRAPKSDARDEAFRKAIRSIPKGKVATYGQVAAAAGYPLYHRHVAQLLQKSGGTLPWQRVVGAGGAIKLKCGSGLGAAHAAGDGRRAISREARGYGGASVPVQDLGI